jgi:hypothetical protein
MPTIYPPGFPPTWQVPTPLLQRQQVTAATSIRGVTWSYSPSIHEFEIDGTGDVPLTNAAAAAVQWAAKAVTTQRGEHLIYSRDFGTDIRRCLRAGSHAAVRPRSASDATRRQRDVRIADLTDFQFIWETTILRVAHARRPRQRASANRPSFGIEIFDELLNERSVFAGLDATLPQAIINRQSDANLRQVALSAFVLLAPGMDTAEGSFAYDLIEPFCLVLAQAYIDLIDVERRTSLATATGLDLDRLGELYAVSRGPSSWAVGTVTFTGATRLGLPISTVVSTVGAKHSCSRPTSRRRSQARSDQQHRRSRHSRRRWGATFVDPVGGCFRSGTVPAGISSITNAAAFISRADVSRTGAEPVFSATARTSTTGNTRGEGGAAQHLRKWARGVFRCRRRAECWRSPHVGLGDGRLLGTNGLPASADVVHAVGRPFWTLVHLSGGQSAPIVRTGLVRRSRRRVTASPWERYQQRGAFAQSLGSFLRQFNVGPVLRHAPGQPWRVAHKARASRSVRRRRDQSLEHRHVEHQHGDVGVTPERFDLVPPDVPGEPFYDGVCQPGHRPDLHRLRVEWLRHHRTAHRPGGTDTTTSVYIDQINYFAVMSRDDRDVGLSGGHAGQRHPGWICHRQRHGHDELLADSRQTVLRSVRRSPRRSRPASSVWPSAPTR